MKERERRLPLSTAALVFGAFSIPLSFAWHLCSLALVLGIYGIGTGLWGRWMASRHLLRYTAKSIRNARVGLRLAIAGTICALVMWVLYASNWLLT